MKQIRYRAELAAEELSSHQYRDAGMKRSRLLPES